MDFKFNVADLDRQEAFQYRHGQRVELKVSPGVVDIIAEYDPMMVPPIFLVNDPKPRYPEELTLLPRQIVNTDWLRAVARRKVQLSTPQSLSHRATLQVCGTRK
ncbi:MAG: hypothetical protein NVS2B14_09200 [Chamaesiphon sp.]